MLYSKIATGLMIVICRINYVFSTIVLTNVNDNTKSFKQDIVQNDTKCFQLPQLPDRIISAYVGNGVVGEPVIKAVKSGVNVLTWFLLEFLTDAKDPTKPFIGHSLDFKAIANTIHTIEKLNLKHKVIHMVSVGGWNGPAPPYKTISARTYFEAFDKWNKEVVAQPEYNFTGFDGLDWDLEGNDDISSPYNTLTAGVIHFMGEFSQLAKQKEYLITLAPPESYLDQGINKYDTSLTHNYQFFHKEFYYHGYNSYAPLYSEKYRYTKIERCPGVVTKTVDFAFVQLYETFSRSNYYLQHTKTTSAQYFHSFMVNHTNRRQLPFSNVPELEIPSQNIILDKEDIVFGLACFDSPKGGYISVAQLRESYYNLRESNLVPRGYGFWVITKEFEDQYVPFSNQIKDFFL